MKNVTVLIICKNDADFIGETISSVKNQSFPFTQIHVHVSSFSSDSTLEIVKNSRVNYSCFEDKSMGDAANKCVHGLGSDYIMIIGGDDLLEPYAIEWLINEFDQSPNIGFVFGNIKVINEGGQQVGRIMGKKFDIDDMFWKNWVPSQSVMIKTSVLPETVIYDDLLCADWMLWIKLGAVFESKYVNKIIGSYRTHQGSTSLNSLARMIDDLEIGSETLLTNENVTARLNYSSNRARAGVLLTTSALAAKIGKLDKALQKVIKAIRSYPKSILHIRFWKTLIIIILNIFTKPFSSIRNS